MALLVLENLGVDITALVAGLGIGGIAVALAAQNVLADLFASVSILLDKPFEVGDTIHVGDMIGTVQNIGIKTTRLRSVTGEQLVMSNSDLLRERIRNYKRMTERRALFTVSVTYDTPVATLEKIPQLVRAIVEAQPNTRFDRAHLHSFGDSSLDFEVAYFITRAEYMVFMDVQQIINLSLLRQLQELGVSFAFPTRTVHLLRDGA
jgi:small-conductance mechanosensitive channel